MLLRMKKENDGDHPDPAGTMKIDALASDVPLDDDPPIPSTGRPTPPPLPPGSFGPQAAAAPAPAPISPSHGAKFYVGVLLGILVVAGIGGLVIGRTLRKEAPLPVVVTPKVISIPAVDMSDPPSP